MDLDRAAHTQDTGQRANVHISYTQGIRPHHRTVAGLASRYARQGGRLLEIGCGVGHTLSMVAESRPDLKIVAADIDSNTLAITQERAPVETTLKIDSVEDLFDKPERYDAIILSHVLEHTFRPLDVLHGALNLLNPDGVLILAVPNPVRLTVFLSNISRRHYVNRGHVYAWDRSHWINFLENIAGVSVLEYSQDYFPLPLLGRFRLFKPLERSLASVFPWLAFSNIAVVESPQRGADGDCNPRRLRSA